MNLKKHKDGSGKELEYFLLKRHELDGILSQPGETYEPRGLFLCRDRIGKGLTVYTAMRNLDGTGETEEFRALEPAVHWLYGMRFMPTSLYRDPPLSEDALREIADMIEDQEEGRGIICAL